MKRVMIDPGHGPGNVNKGPTGYYEYKGMWTLSNYLKAELEKRGVAVGLTRTETEDPELDSRGLKATGYDLFISEHSNAYGTSGVRGVEVFHSLRRTDMANAGKLSAAIAKCMNTPNRGAKTRSYTRDSTTDWYGIVRNAARTNVKHIFLCESGFHTSREDEAWLKKDSNLKLLAKAQSDVICDILGVGIIDPQPEPKPDPVPDETMATLKLIYELLRTIFE